MERKPTYAGKVKEKDELDILFWAFEKSSVDRLNEAWRLNCLNNGLDLNARLNKNVMAAHKRN